VSGGAGPAPAVPPADWHQHRHLPLRCCAARQAKHPRDADVVISTVHKMKGLEAPYVQLYDDFIDLEGLLQDLRKLAGSGKPQDRLVVGAARPGLRLALRACR
jgi:hypothetical protein